MWFIVHNSPFHGRRYKKAVKIMADYLDIEKCEAIARMIHEEMNKELKPCPLGEPTMDKPLTVGELKEIVKDLPDNTRVIVSWACCGNDTPQVYVEKKHGCKRKKILVIEG